MLFIYDDDKRSYCGKSLLPFGLRRRRAVCFTSAPPDGWHRLRRRCSHPNPAARASGQAGLLRGLSTTRSIGAGDPADQEADGCEKVQSAGRRRVRDKRERGVCGQQAGDAVCAVEAGRGAPQRSAETERDCARLRAAGFTGETGGEALICPEGKRLVKRATAKRHGHLNVIYQAEEGSCEGVAKRAACCGHEGKRGPKRIERVVESEEMKKYQARMESEEGRQAYKERSRLGEYAQMQLKAVRGLTRFRLKGLKKVRQEAKLWAIAYNIAQWIRLSWKKPPTWCRNPPWRPEKAKRPRHQAQSPLQRAPAE